MTEIKTSDMVISTSPQYTNNAVDNWKNARDIAFIVAGQAASELLSQFLRWTETTETGLGIWKPVIGAMISAAIIWVNRFVRDNTLSRAIVKAATVPSAHKITMVP